MNNSKHCRQLTLLNTYVPLNYRTSRVYKYKLKIKI